MVSCGSSGNSGLSYLGIGGSGMSGIAEVLMNQGYVVIEYIHGKDTKPADYSLLQDQFSGLPNVMDAEEILSLYQQRVPMFKRMRCKSRGMSAIRLLAL